MSLDPAFLGMYVYESNTNFWRKWDSCSLIVTYSISLLYHVDLKDRFSQLRNHFTECCFYMKLIWYVQLRI